MILGPAVIRQVRAAAALLAFTNVLAVSLFGLVPGNNVGYPAPVLSVIGILFTAATIRSILSSPSTLSERRRQLGLLILLVLIFGTELAEGIVLIAEPRAIVAVQVISNVLAASLLTGIARAWELVGDRQTNITRTALRSRTADRHPKPPAPPKLVGCPCTKLTLAGQPA